MKHGVFRALTYFIATGFGAGWLPIAPGTWGSIVGLLLGIIAYYFDFLGLFCFLTFFLGWLVTEAVIREDKSSPDPSFIVIDEIAGIGLTLWFGFHILLPFPVIVFLSFILFRLFDIKKPFPIGWIEVHLESIPPLRSLGIMLDDIAAAILAGTSILLISIFIDLW